MRRALRLIPVLLLLSGVPAALAAFTSTSGASNSVSTDTDWTRPTIARTIVAKSTGYLGGSVKQGGTYYVYANITDSGNPASGMSGGSAGGAPKDTNNNTGHTSG